MQVNFSGLVLDLNAPLGIALLSVEAGEEVYIGTRIDKAANGNLVPGGIYAFIAARNIHAGENLWAKDIRVEDMSKKQAEVDVPLLVEETLEDYKERQETEDREDPWKQRIAEVRARREEQ